jgi:hypothetical protein
MKKVYDLAVKVGSYQKDGETKNRYENVGAIMSNDNGQFMFLKRTFNPAGIDSEGKESIIISMFAPKEKSENSSKEPEIPSWDSALPF